MAPNGPMAARRGLHDGLASTVGVLSWLVAGTNLSHGARTRGMGEHNQREGQRRALRSMGLPAALAMNTAGSLVVCAGGGFMMALAPAAESNPWWAALGVVAFGVTGLVHLNVAMVRLRFGGKGA